MDKSYEEMFANGLAEIMERKGGRESIIVQLCEADNEFAMGLLDEVKTLISAGNESLWVAVELLKLITQGLEQRRASGMLGGLPIPKQPEGDCGDS
jgi:hypothetical protein